ncbi:tRNA synthetases class II (D, K and N) [Musa troglodytarum]|uniref:asparagine--tRNA ligase n=1 Tax=Musa troglodytarum TaxID=320322 RepID=A0A9E7H9L4_9LILI|nr:tRNA synthetases class II (D, K and N) [Musa troglodytarum]URE26075.1 tRNA synthetases class II (D, K and N) [Musa troglodytarum]URE26079.1 tRNA synthetases class II (D, K and N) [Musa troglodytarum]
MASGWSHTEQSKALSRRAPKAPFVASPPNFPVMYAYIYSISAGCPPHLLSHRSITVALVIMESGRRAAAGRNQMLLLPPPIQRFKYSKRVMLKSILDREDEGLAIVGHRVAVGGWVNSRKERAEADDASSPTRPAQADDEVLVQYVPFLRPISSLPGALAAATSKDKHTIVYLLINDGSCITNLQLVMDSSMSVPGQVVTVGNSILVEGVLRRTWTGTKRVVELIVEKLLHVGAVDLKTYPLAKPQTSLPFLRDHLHLRPRFITIGSVARIRSSLTCACHAFFNDLGMIHVHMPIITSVATGSQSQRFQVTTLLDTSDQGHVDLEAFKAAVQEKRSRIKELRRGRNNKEALTAAKEDLEKSKELVRVLEERQKTATVYVGDVKLSEDFFGRAVYLSTSAGLHLESYACGLSGVYTIGPVFQADESRSAKKLAEMWMVEVELAFAELEDVMNCAEDLLRSLCYSLLATAGNDLKFAATNIDGDCIKRLQSITSRPFDRITYSNALHILNQVKDRSFLTQAVWGADLSEEHERYLADDYFENPVIVYEFPQEIKPFYARGNANGITVSAFEIIAPKAMLARGSQKEERLDVIRKRIEEVGLPQEQFDWYMDLRKHGSVKRSGFSLEFEKMVMMATGITDAEDAIPFPRARGDAKL